MRFVLQAQADLQRLPGLDGAAFGDEFGDDMRRLDGLCPRQQWQRADQYEGRQQTPGEPMRGAAGDRLSAPARR